MIRHKWIVGVRNSLANIAGEFDSAAAIEGAKMTSAEREYFQNRVRCIVDELDEKLRK